MNEEKNTNSGGQGENETLTLRFSDYFSTPGVRILSVFFGLIAGLAVGLFTGWQIGVLTGACVTLVASLILPVMLYRADLPYLRIKRTIKDKFLFDERVRFAVRNGRSMGGFFILTERSIILLSLERGNHRLDLARGEIRSVVMEEDRYSMKIFLNDKQFILVVSGVCEELYGILRENGWNAG